MSIKCPTCDGCGYVANDEDRTPWHLWEKLPPQAKMAIQMGLVRKLRCPACNGESEADDG
jgi:hypothetical protein